MICGCFEVLQCPPLGATEQIQEYYWMTAVQFGEVRDGSRPPGTRRVIVQKSILAGSHGASELHSRSCHGAWLWACAFYLSGFRVVCRMPLIQQLGILSMRTLKKGTAPLASDYPRQGCGARKQPKLGRPADGLWLENSSSNLNSSKTYPVNWQR